MADIKKQQTITKSFHRKISRPLPTGWESWEFGTTVQETVEVGSAEDIAREHERLFQQAKLLTEIDMETTKAEQESKQAGA